MPDSLTVQTRPDGITVYRLANQAPETLLAWAGRLRAKLDGVRQAQRAGEETTSLIVHDLRACGIPGFGLLKSLRDGLSAVRDLNVRCAVVIQSESIAQMVERMMGVPGEEDSETLRVSSRDQVWSAGATVVFLNDFEAAVNWLKGEES